MHSTMSLPTQTCLYPVCCCPSCQPVLTSPPQCHKSQSWALSPITFSCTQWKKWTEPLFVSNLVNKHSPAIDRSVNQHRLQTAQWLLLSRYTSASRGPHTCLSEGWLCSPWCGYHTHRQAHNAWTQRAGRAGCHSF